MDERQIAHEEVVEEIIDDDSEIYEEMVEVDDGDEVIMDAVEVDVEDMDYVPEEGDYQYMVPSNARNVPGPSYHNFSHRSQSDVDFSNAPYMHQSHYQRPQSPQYMLAIRGNKVYRVDKSSGIATFIRSTTGQRTADPLFQPQQDYQSARRFYTTVKTIHRPAPAVSASYRAKAFQTSRLLPSQYPKLAEKKKPAGIGNKKPCNCTKSMCLKLYCECFANGEFCKDCNCKSCHNNLEHEVERSKAIKASLERNPNAFKPKIGIASRGRIDSERLHQKGCHCRKSNCLKNYCECYEAKVPCTERCKCVSCRNTENDRAAKFPAKFIPTSDAGPLNESLLDTNRTTNSPFSDEESDQDSDADGRSLPWLYINDEVIEATTLCLVSRAEAAESAKKMTDEEMERALLQEFGRCLGQIISATTTVPTA